MKRMLLVIAAVLAGYGAADGQTQPGAAEQIGQQIDRGLSQLGAELSEAWKDVRRGVEKMGIEGRVYGRLHWDKALDGAKLDIGVREGNAVILTGTVASEAARQKAEELARETVGVGSVINQLTIAQPAR